VPNAQWKTPDDGQRNCPKHVEFLDINKFGKISASVGFIKKKFVTMHGHVNVKFCELRHGVHYLQSCKPAGALTGVMSAPPIPGSPSSFTDAFFFSHCSFLLIGSVVQRCRPGP